MPAETQISEQYVNQQSRPSDLKITDMRVVHLKGIPMRVPLIRIDTNQGICGYGEVRDGASSTYALMLKSRILGENPCNIDRVFRKIKQFGFHARQAGGVCGIEMALMDLAGKAYGVPAYMLAGGKFRDKVLVYSDTPSEPDGKAMGKRLKARMDQGFKFLKMDLGIYFLRNIPDTVIGFPDTLRSFNIMHPFTGIQLTDKGIDYLCRYVDDVRSVIGYEVPLAVDHIGHIGLESCIRLGRALDQFTLAWLEDLLPWQFTDQYVTLSRAVTTPICTGEDIYLKKALCRSSRSALFRSSIPIWHRRAAFWRPRRSAMQRRSMVLLWRCIWQAHRSRHWPASTVPQQPKTSWSWRITRSTNPVERPDHWPAQSPDPGWLYRRARNAGAGLRGSQRGHDP